jgi:hypothetical protein
MSQLGEGDEFSLVHLSFGFLHEGTLFWGEDVIGINQTLRLDEHPVLLFGECHKIPLLEVEGFEHIPRNDHLAPLAHAADPLLGCG